MCTFTKGAQVGLALRAVLVDLHHLPPDILWRPNVIVTIMTAVLCDGLQSGASLLYIYCALHNFCRKVVDTGLDKEDREKIRSTECDAVLFGSISTASVK